jgi:hypothetical protein
MTILIDDSNWGCLLRGCLIGTYRIETKEMLVGEIPVHYFQEPKFSAKEYLTVAANIAEENLNKLHIDKNEPITCCSGFVLSEIREMLWNKKYHFNVGKIVGDFQEKLEAYSLQYLEEIGFKRGTLQLEEYKNLFYECLVWLKDGDMDSNPIPEREIHAKTGWGSYGIWAYHDLKTAQILAKERKDNNRW